MHVRTPVAAAVVLATSIGLAAARDLTVVTRGGPMQEATQELFARAFTDATTIAVEEETWEGGIDALHTQAKAPENRLGPRAGGRRRAGHRLLRRPVREARLDDDRRQGPLPAAGRQRLRRRGRCRQPRSRVGSRQVSRHAWLGGILGRREVSRQTRPQSRRAWQSGGRADRRRRGARRRLQGAGHLRRCRSRLPQARPAQALRRVVAGWHRGFTYPRLGRRADDAAHPRRGSPRSTARNTGISASSGMPVSTRCRAGRS